MHNPWPFSLLNQTTRWTNSFNHLDVTASAATGVFNFDPFSILKGFPTPHAPDVSPEHAASAASGIANTIRISQPGSGFPAVYSNQFTV